MVRMMDIPDPRGRGSFWEAYRAGVEENKVRPDRSPFYPPTQKAMGFARR